MSKAQVDKEVFFRRLKKIRENWEVSPWLLGYLQIADLSIECDKFRPTHLELLGSNLGIG